jgi:hypothetical protein
MSNEVNRKLSSHSCPLGLPARGLLMAGVILFSFPSTAQVYPVDGVWTSIDPDFPDSNCLALKTFGVDAVSNKSINELMIFSKDKRYDLKGDVRNETTIKSIKKADGSFRITETFATKSVWWLGFKRKTTYFLKIVNPLKIEIWNGTVLSRYGKCDRRPPI